MSEREKYPGLPPITPDPQIQLTTWADSTIGQTQRTYHAAVRRAFIQMMVARHPIRDATELREAVKRRFGAAPSTRLLLQDMKNTGIVRVPIPGLGTRLKLVAQLNDANIEDELDERIRIDTMLITRRDNDIFMEVNRGTATAFVQLFNLTVDEGSRPGVVGVTSDGDKWVALHFADGARAMEWERWLENKIM